MLKIVAALFMGVAVSGCVTTQEMPLAPNAVRIDTQARGSLFTDDAVPETMKAAATATLKRGFTHFKFSDASMNQGTYVAGVVTSGRTNVNGRCTGSFCSSTSAGFGTAQVIHAPTTSAAATVIMFKADDPQAKDAFDAQAVLKQYDD